MQDSRLMIALATDPEKKNLKTDIALWKVQRSEYYNSRTDEWILVFKCPMNYRCRCPAKVRICTGNNYKRLEFFGTHDEQTHDEQSHAVDYSKTLSYKQIVTIHDAVMVAQKQSATVLRRKVMHSRASQAHASVSAKLYPATCPDIPEDFDKAETRCCIRARIHWRAHWVVRDKRFLCSIAQAQRSCQ